MRRALILQMWIVLFLGTFSRMGNAQVANAKVLRGNSITTDLYRSDENITVTSAGGFISSPNYPKAYPRNLCLSWKLLSPPGTVIHLEFDEQFNIEEPVKGKCSYDYVEVEEKSQSSTIKWGRWCGQKAPSSLTSKSNTLRITFKSDDYFVAKPGFKIHYSLVGDTNLEAAPELLSDMGTNEMPTTEVPQTLEDLDKTIATFDTIEELLKSLSPATWRQDLESIYTQTYIYYRSKSYHLASRQNKVDLNRLHDDVKRFSCTPRNYSVNLREELKTTNAVFFPRCLLVKRCGGNCGCGTNNWNTGCSCQPLKTTTKLHEVLKYSPETSPYKQQQQKQRVRWVIGEIFLSHHETCECACPLQPPR
ncbi:PREDICTED: platelet-derived growth factor D [Cyprinodon variegatus]|uniref:Platelet derived growth factor D n=1 Tax=Cyprinodon variegatus TaxID=28743 RepID=A0A3Q2D7T8_CYPVA|nr:PREDICTED: platelet-derived growth factor D [Cyprinodon variegatus]